MQFLCFWRLYVSRGDGGGVWAHVERHACVGEKQHVPAFVSFVCHRGADGGVLLLVKNTE